MICWTIDYGNCFSLHVFPNKMMFDVNMFCSFVSNGVLCHRNCSLIIFKDLSGLLSILMRKSFMKCRDHIASCVASPKAMYSASAVERATVCCF